MRAVTTVTLQKSLTERREEVQRELGVQVCERSVRVWGGVRAAVCVCERDVCVQ